MNDSAYLHLASKIFGAVNFPNEDFAALRNGKKVVFTNGCFDILHAGHVHYLARAAEFGDILVVGMNDDESVAELKGPSRPINSQMARSMVLAGLSSVDFVVVFSGKTVAGMISRIQPDVWVKGADYATKTLDPREVQAAKDVGANIALVYSPVDESTTKIIGRLQNGAAEESAG